MDTGMDTGMDTDTVTGMDVDTDGHEEVAATTLPVAMQNPA
ncbi:hypothetical protein [Streptomyces sclerotialus]